MKDGGELLPEQNVLGGQMGWEIRITAEAALPQVMDNFPDELNGAVLKAQKRAGQEPDGKKVEEAVEQYKKLLGKAFGKAGAKAK